MIEKSKVFFATFGSDHLSEFNIRPMSIMVYIPDEPEHVLRQRLNKPPFNNQYCTTYPIDHAEQMIKKYEMTLYTMDELLRLKKD